MSNESQRQAILTMLKEANSWKRDKFKKEPGASKRLDPSDPDQDGDTDFKDGEVGTHGLLGKDGLSDGNDIAAGEDDDRDSGSILAHLVKLLGK